MDTLSHALIAYILFSHPALSPLIPFAIIGAVLPDADVFFSVLADRNPSLYLFSHGGITHSFAGATLMSLPAYGCCALLGTTTLLHPVFPAVAIHYALAAMLAGALLHIAIDLLAVPGIPVLAPFSDRKYTLGILPGPSFLLAFAAIGTVLITSISLLPLPSALLLYTGTAWAYLIVRASSFLLADAKLPGRKIPTINPLRWLVIGEDDRSYTVRYYTFFRGYSGEAVFEKFRDTTAGELAGISQSGEVRRLVFHSYCVTAERIGSVLILADPLREKGYLHYPHKFRRVAVQVKPAA